MAEANFHFTYANLPANIDLLLTWKNMEELKDGVRTEHFGKQSAVAGNISAKQNCQSNHLGMSSGRTNSWSGTRVAQHLHLPQELHVR